ncbi:MAG: hypothetical protein MJZ76_00320, partial [Bacteroidales bacterium]|nr:hypothetical protein [Bacteroidales bacterium]
YICRNLNDIEMKKQTYKRTGNCGLFDWEENTAKLESHGMFSRAVGFARNAARNVLTSLVYNRMRYEQILRLGMN